jgi:hydroxyethylthiazole kinase-like uncharacterized protein yjeF
MSKLEIADIKGKIYLPPADSHKGQNGKLLIIGGSTHFHAASLWALKIASRVVDMVFYHSVDENLAIIKEIKKDFHDGIVVTSQHLEDYIREVDGVLIGPGLPRGSDPQDYPLETSAMVKKLIDDFPDKKFVFDASALQEMKPEWLLKLKTKPILTPHQKEFEELFKIKIQTSKIKAINQRLKIVKKEAEKYNCVILLKGSTDIICSPDECKTVSGGNSGMTKGGTGDVLAGLTAALYCKNEAFISATTASYVNKKAGDNLFSKVGYYFNASDLVDEIPKVLKDLI